MSAFGAGQNTFKGKLVQEAVARLNLAFVFRFFRDPVYPTNFFIVRAPV